jgi:type I restriction-modification system DNA methylase subunit
MAGERTTEALVLAGMGITIGKNEFGYLFAQGGIENIEKLTDLLKKAGGKPDKGDEGGKGQAKPEYIITFDKTPDTIIVIECKKNIKDHESAGRSRPKGYAVDGALYYAKYLKEEYNVIAIAVSGIKALKVTSFYWRKGEQEPQELQKCKDVLYSPENYLRIISGGTARKMVSVEDIQKLALQMHDSLRVLKVTERDKPIFIAGILIVLKDTDFMNEYRHASSFDSLLGRLQVAIEKVFKNSDVKTDKVEYIKDRFKVIGRSGKIKDYPLNQDNSLLWYISELDKKIKPMMDYADSTIDALGMFYHEFVKYSGGDGSGLGIVLTPQHLTEFMCDLADIGKNSRVVDICCGSGAFLVSAMAKMFKSEGINDNDIERIRRHSLFGVELDSDIYTLAIANMIVRGDGKSNILDGDCFNPKTINELKEKNLNVGLINPPYSQKDHTELEFVEVLLDILAIGGKGVVVVPMSCAIGTKFKEERERLFKKHTLKAVFSMPDDVFYSNSASTNVCVMVWEAHRPHNSEEQSFFGYYKDDGFVKAKKLGRIDKNNRWAGIKKEWIRLYREREVKEGLTVKKAIHWDDEWLCEAYIQTDYSKLTQEDFEKTVRDYLAYLLRSGGRQ